MSLVEGFLEAKGGSSWRQFVETQAGKAVLLEDQPEVPSGFSVGSRWARWMLRGWTQAQTGIGHFPNQRWMATNKRQPGAKHLL